MVIDINSIKKKNHNYTWMHCVIIYTVIDLLSNSTSAPIKI